MTITQVLNAIRTAVFGKDVREAIAAGIEKCYQDSTASGQIAEIEAAAEAARASIPQEYTALSDSVKTLESEMNLAGEKLSLNDGTYGKSYEGLVGGEYWISENAGRCSIIPPIRLGTSTLELTVNSGYRISIREINPNTNRIVRDSGWILSNGTYEANSAYVYGIDYCLIDDTPTTVVDLAENIKVTARSKLAGTIENINTALRGHGTTIDLNNGIKDMSYEGHVGQEYYVQSKENRYSIIPPVEIDNDVISINIKPGYRFSFRAIDPETNKIIADSNWIYTSGSYDIPYGYLYGFAYGKNNDSPTTAAELIENIQIVTKRKIVQSIDDLTGRTNVSKYYNIKSINHRGYNSIAPENTLPAFKLSKKHEFQYVETDIRFTSDGVPVLLHDESINRTARNADGTIISSTINIRDITYAEALTYDFGIWKSEEYSGTKIPTLHEFLDLCKKIGLTPRIEFNAPMSNSEVALCMSIISEFGMIDKVEYNCNWESGIDTILENYDEATIVWGTGSISSALINNIISRKTRYNRFIINIYYESLTADMIAMANNAKIPIEVWTVDNSDYNIPNYVSGITSNSINFGILMQDANI